MYERGLIPFNCLVLGPHFGKQVIMFFCNLMGESVEVMGSRVDVGEVPVGWGF